VIILAVHAGAGPLVTPELEHRCHDGLASALRAGQEALGTSVSAVEAAVRVLEDNELFNAGKGSVFTVDGGHELDASIMRGSDLAAGAVAAVRGIRNPILAARLVMESTTHVMLAGLGADEFARRSGLAMVSQDYYWTQRRWEQSQGTVGAVALGQAGDLAAATSTGGMTNKLTGRVGDSAVIGAGTYANKTVAISATGDGEVFLRGMAAGTIAALMELAGMDVVSAASEVVRNRLTALGGTGGVIALDKTGTFTAPHTTPGMLHGYLTSTGDITTFASS
jgi:beta-aspartyl-peptidase (threonine type)